MKENCTCDKQLRDTKYPDSDSVLSQKIFPEYLNVTGCADTLSTLKMFALFILPKTRNLPSLCGGNLTENFGSGVIASFKLNIMGSR